MHPGDSRPMLHMWKSPPNPSYERSGVPRVFTRSTNGSRFREHREIIATIAVIEGKVSLDLACNIIDLGVETGRLGSHQQRMQHTGYGEEPPPGRALCFQQGLDFQLAGVVVPRGGIRIDRVTLRIAVAQELLPFRLA